MHIRLLASIYIMLLYLILLNLESLWSSGPMRRLSCKMDVKELVNITYIYDSSDTIASRIMVWSSKCLELLYISINLVVSFKVGSLYYCSPNIPQPQHARSGENLLSLWSSRSSQLDPLNQLEHHMQAFRMIQPPSEVQWLKRNYCICPLSEIVITILSTPNHYA